MSTLKGPDREQLDSVVEIVRGVLGREVLGAYLFGSAALGGLKPESDLDVLVVASRRMTQEEKELLVERLAASSGRSEPTGRRRRVEVTVVVASEIRPWRYPPRMDLQYGDWLRGAFERNDAAAWAPGENPDLAPLLTMTLQADLPLVGPPPAELIDPVPHEDLLAATVGYLDDVAAELADGDTRNVILTLARVWSTVVTGVIRSKDAAAEWALARLPEEERLPLARARAIYLGDEEERWDDIERQVRSCVEVVVAAIRRSADGALRPGRER